MENTVWSIGLRVVWNWIWKSEFFSSASLWSKLHVLYNMESRHSNQRVYMYVYIYIYIYVVNFDALAQASDFRCRIRTQRVSRTESPADWMSADKPTELSRIKLKTWNSIARPYDQRAFIQTYTIHIHVHIHTHIHTHTHIMYKWSKHDYLMGRIQSLWNRRACSVFRLRPFFVWVSVRFISLHATITVCWGAMCSSNQWPVVAVNC